MPSSSHSKLTFAGLCKQAKRYKKEHAGVSLRQAQDFVAKEAGYNNFHHAQQVLTRKEAEAGASLPQLPEACRAVLQRIIQAGERQVIAAVDNVTGSEIFELDADVKVAWRLLDKLGGRVEDAAPAADPHHIDFEPGERIRVVIEDERTALIYLRDEAARADFADIADEIAFNAAQEDLRLFNQLRDKAEEDVKYLRVHPLDLCNIRDYCELLADHGGFQGELITFKGEEDQVTRIDGLLRQLLPQVQRLCEQL